MDTWHRIVLLIVNTISCVYIVSVVHDLLQITIGLCFSLGCVHANNLMYQEYIWLNWIYSTAVSIH